MNIQISTPENPRKPELRILRLDEVKKMVGLSRSAIYDRMDINSKRYDATFPKQVNLGGSAVGWLKHEIEDWIHLQMLKRQS